MRNLHLNEDDAHFYACHPAEDMCVAGLERLVDFYAEGTQVAALLFCVTMQKALFDSRTREPLYHGYQPDGPDDQPFLRVLPPGRRGLVAGDHGRNWVHNLWLLNRGRGIDQFAVWLARCRRHGIEGWLTARMNDAHGLKERAIAEAGGAPDDHGWVLLCQAQRWLDHPEWRRAPYRPERSWEGAFDWAHAAVRQEQIAFVSEVFERWDLDGFEMDWLRWGMNFAPGGETAGCAILSDFTAEVRAIADAAARRRGHPIRLGVRVPAEPATCLELGYDVAAWAERGLVDQVVLSNFGGEAWCEYPLALWRRLLGPRVRLLTHGADLVKPYPGCVPAAHHEVHLGCAAAALGRGCDGLYFFNECYAESDGRRDDLADLLRTAGSAEALARRARIHAAAGAGMRAPGSGAGAAPLPAPLANRTPGWDFGRMERTITVRIDCGRRPAAGGGELSLGLHGADARTLAPGGLEVRWNTRVLAPSASRSPSLAERSRLGWRLDGLERADATLAWRVPAAALQDGINVLEVTAAHADAAGALRTAEIRLDGRD
ncbi:MAG: hypothetical protein L6R48_01660 [Planctomycetes bacterium]|nr:hypothetical protein [Planctomycetota bacterium]